MESGHDWLKIADPALYADPSAIVPILDPDALHAFAAQHGIHLTGTTPIRPDPAPMMTDTPLGLATRLRIGEA